MKIVFTFISIMSIALSALVFMLLQTWMPGFAMKYIYPAMAILFMVFVFQVVSYIFLGKAMINAGNNNSSGS